jgi:flagellar motor switch protein FliM
MSSNSNPDRQSKPPYYVLDPRTIGRPVHLIDKFTAQLREDVADRFCTPLNRRYRACFEVRGISLIQMAASPGTPHRLLNYQTAAGRMCFAVDRSLLLCVLGYRFGTHGGEPESAGGPESASEERLNLMLGSQLVSIVSSRIEAQGSRMPDAPRTDILDVSTGVPPEDAWTLRVEIAERARKVEGSVWFLLDAACVERLLASLSASRPRAVAHKSAPAVQPLPARLQFTLTARLLDTEIALGVLMDTSIGDVIPISLRGADVLIGTSLLFTASVAEHRGKLCLTSFEDVE